jgi:hypothetical protein
MASLLTFTCFPIGEKPVCGPVTSEYFYPVAKKNRQSKAVFFDDGVSFICE